MSDKLDNDLKNRIWEVFDNYQDETADAGWELLRQKFPAEQKKRRVVAWWWYPAAAVLLLGMAVWFFYPQPAPQVVYQPQKPGLYKKGSSAVVSAGKKVTVNKPAENQAIARIVPNKQTADLQKITPENRTINPSSPINNTRPAVGGKTMPGNTLTTAVAAQPYKNGAARYAQPGVMVNIPANTSAPLQNNTGQIKAPVLGSVNSQSMAKVTPQPAANLQNQNNTIADDIIKNNPATALAAQQPANAAQTAAVQQKTDAVLKMIAADDARQQAIAKNAVKKKEAVKADRAMILSLYAATYFNYAKGSESQVNVGGGFTSDFKLSNNFKLSTGLSIAQNKLNYNNNNNIPQQISQKAASAAVVASDAKAPGTLFVSSQSPSVPAVKNYNASLVGLDIPLNIKYQFNPQKNDTYISAGISSGTYINETYRSTYSYNNSNVNAFSSVASNFVSASNPAQQTQETTTNQHFSTFDFAKTLNLSFGIGYPVGKRNRLVIEPFLKYPLSGLGAQNISFGSSGVNLKLSFSSKK